MARALFRRHPLEAYGTDREPTIFTNVAATAQLTHAAVVSSLLASAFYNGYAGRDNVSSRTSSTADGRTSIFTTMVNHFRQKIEEFVGADPQQDALLYFANTSDAIGKLALSFRFTSQDVVLLPQMEHTSNSLPWEKSGAKVERIRQYNDGQIDLADLEAKLQKHAGGVRLVAFTAASNILGTRPDVKTIVGRAHKYGALASVDAAQYAPHFPMDKKGWGADFISFSGHKVGAGSGIGVLAVPRWWLEKHDPAVAGGGSILDFKRAEGTPQITWSPGEAKHQPGTWNTLGVIALGAVAESLSDNWGWIMEREHQLLEYAYEKFGSIAGFEPLPVYRGQPESHLTPVISFNFRGYSPSEVSTRLAQNGIQNRGGDNETICNHLFIHDVLQLPGIVRLSFNYHNTLQEVDRIAEVMGELRRERPL